MLRAVILISVALLSLDAQAQTRGLWDSDPVSDAENKRRAIRWINHPVTTEEDKEGFRRYLQFSREYEESGKREKEEARQKIRFFEDEMKWRFPLPENAVYPSGEAVDDRSKADHYLSFIRAQLTLDANKCSEHMEALQQLVEHDKFARKLLFLCCEFKAEENPEELASCSQYQENALSLFREEYDKIQKDKAAGKLPEPHYSNAVFVACSIFRRSPQYAAYTLTEQAEAETELKDICPAE